MPLINNRNLDGKELWFLENVPDIPNFPVLWIDLGADVESVRRQKCLAKMQTSQNVQDQSLVEKLISELVTPVRILEIGQWAAIGVGAGLVVAALVFSVIFSIWCKGNTSV